MVPIYCSNDFSQFCFYLFHIEQIPNTSVVPIAMLRCPYIEGTVNAIQAFCARIKFVCVCIEHGRIPFQYPKDTEVAIHNLSGKCVQCIFMLDASSPKSCALNVCKLQIELIESGFESGVRTKAARNRASHCFKKREQLLKLQEE